MKPWQLRGDGTVDPAAAKYLVVRRDGTIPEWPSFIMGAHDPAVPAGTFAYAQEARKIGFEEDYCRGVELLAEEFVRIGGEWKGKPADPHAPRHRPDNPEIIRIMAGERGDFSKLGPDTSEEVAEIASRLMSHPDPDVRRVAASALGQRQP